MDILFLLVPLSVVLVLLIIGVFAWALHGGQFDDLEREGGRILATDDRDTAVQHEKVDVDQASR
jgi:cbb3-type cytochrome oxidase maturation protein